MKKIILVIAAVMLFSACGQVSVADKINDLADDIEQNSESWTEEDWQTAKDEYELLILQYTDNYDKYSDQEKKAITKAVGRYSGLLMKQGLVTAGEYIEDFSDKLPSLVDGFMEVFDDAEDSDQ